MNSSLSILRSFAISFLCSMSSYKALLISLTDWSRSLALVAIYFNFSRSYFFIYYKLDYTFISWLSCLSCKCLDVSYKVSFLVLIDELLPLTSLSTILIYLTRSSSPLDFSRFYSTTFKWSLTLYTLSLIYSCRFRSCSSKVSLNSCSSSSINLIISCFVLNLFFSADSNALKCSRSFKNRARSAYFLFSSLLCCNSSCFSLRTLYCCLISLM